MEKELAHTMRGSKRPGWQMHLQILLPHVLLLMVVGDAQMPRAGGKDILGQHTLVTPVGTHPGLLVRLPDPHVYCQRSSLQ